MIQIAKINIMSGIMVHRGRKYKSLSFKLITNCYNIILLYRNNPLTWEAIYMYYR